MMKKVTSIDSFYNIDSIYLYRESIWYFEILSLFREEETKAHKYLITLSYPGSHICNPRACDTKTEKPGQGHPRLHKETMLQIN